MKSNYLLLVSNKTMVEELKEESNITFLFPVKDFTVGFTEVFSLDEITIPQAYLFVNRLLGHEEILHFKDFVKQLPSNIEGIVFDDIGVLQVLNEIENSLTKILFLNHFNCNYISINSYLEYVDSVVVSTDVTEKEVDEILLKATKPLVIYTFGHMNIMYSRRKLITNYNEHFKLSNPSVSVLTNDLGQQFKMVENEYGTVIYTNLPFNGLRYRNKKNVLFYLIHSIFLDSKDIRDIIHSEDELKEKYPYQYLSTEETIVRIKEREQ